MLQCERFHALNLPKTCINPFYNQKQKNRKNKVRNDILKAIEANDEADQYVKDRARLIYESCYRKKHLNLANLYDHGFLEFVEGNADKSAELAEKYIHVCKEHNIDHQSSPA